MIREDITQFIKTIKPDVTVVAATKYGDENDILCLVNNGINNIGENRVDSFLVKYTKLKQYNIVWHFIGHLQRNKAKLVIDKIDYLHSLDSKELAVMISRLRKTPLKVFIEVSINLEESKNGVPFFECEEFIKSIYQLPNIQVVGLMMMSKKDSTNQSLSKQFSSLARLRDEIEQKLSIKLPYLSMGMSEDYIEAINNKTTHIRLGRILFK